MKTLLIADDEPNILSGLKLAFEDEGYSVITAKDGNEAWSAVGKNLVDLVITDLRMPGMDGNELLKRLTAAYPALPVIVLTGHGTVETAVEALHGGAIDFFTKPVDLDKLLLVVKKTLEVSSLSEQNRRLSEEIEQLKARQGLGKIIGKSGKMNALMDVLRQVAPTNASVLITGESGTGKELVAESIQALSSRSKGPFIKVSCAAFSQNLLEDELFGHEKGAFTGAVAQKKGRFELADKGTLFLDEIGEIDMSTQVKLLRVLQERQFERVGGEKTITVDVRLICATNRDLAEEVREGRFRQDLYYRLNVVNVQVPPLRERKEDIDLLAAYFLQTFNKEDNKKIEGFTPSARKALFSYSWPGNVRELRNAIEAAVVFCRGKNIDLDDLPPQVKVHSAEASLELTLPITMDEAEKKIIVATLAWCNGNKTKAAEVLDIGRKTLHRKLQELEVEDSDGA